MKRRRFLTLLGAATTAPVLPLPATSAAATAPYSPAAMHAAILHAQSSGHVSVQGLAGILRVPGRTAEKVLSDMIDRGILGPMQGSNPPLGWAKSRIYKPRFAMRVPTQRTNRPDLSETDHSPAKNAEPDTQRPDPLMAHLHSLCRSVGLTLHPRCAAQSFT